VIDLAAAHRQLAEILDRHGLGEASYCITVEVWNHRGGGSGLAVTFTASAILGAECVQAYQRMTIESALGDLDGMLAERARRLAGQTPEDLRVALPGADVGVVEQAAATAAAIPF